jgi:hypothetical protein
MTAIYVKEGWGCSVIGVGMDPGSSENYEEDRLPEKIPSIS